MLKKVLGATLYFKIKKMKGQKAAGGYPTSSDYESLKRTQGSFPLALVPHHMAVLEMMAQH